MVSAHGCDPCHPDSNPGGRRTIRPHKPDLPGSTPGPATKLFCGCIGVQSGLISRTRLVRLQYPLPICTGRRAVKPSPFQGEDRGFKSRPVLQYSDVAKWQGSVVANHPFAGSNPAIGAMACSTMAVRRTDNPQMEVRFFPGQPMHSICPDSSAGQSGCLVSSGSSVRIRLGAPFFC